MAQRLIKANPNQTVALVVATDPGRPAGMVGLEETIDPEQMHPRHDPELQQEEEAVCRWMMGQAGDTTERQNELFRHVIARRWGLYELLNSTDTITRHATGPQPRPHARGACSRFLGAP